MHFMLHDTHDWLYFEIELETVYKNKSLYKQKRKGSRALLLDKKPKRSVKPQQHLTRTTLMILTLLQSVDEPDPGPKPLDKETIFDVSASKLVGKEVQNTDDLSSNPKENPIPIDFSFLAV